MVFLLFSSSSIHSFGESLSRQESSLQINTHLSVYYSVCRSRGWRTAESILRSESEKPSLVESNVVITLEDAYNIRISNIPRNTAQ